MLVLYGVTLSKKKQLIYALPELYGIGRSLAKRIVYELGIPPKLRVQYLSKSQEFALSRKIKEEYRLEGNLREMVKSNIQRYISNGSIRGFRHKHGLPVRGQRTHSNVKTPRRVFMGMGVRVKVTQIVKKVKKK